MPHDRTDTPHSSANQPHADTSSTDLQQEQPPQPDAERARPPRGYDDPLRRERNSGLVPPDADADDEAR